MEQVVDLTGSDVGHVATHDFTLGTELIRLSDIWTGN